MDASGSLRLADGDYNDLAEVDRGAYEFQPIPDCNRNGFRDDLDIRSGRSDDCDNDGIPDECDGPCCCETDREYLVTLCRTLQNGNLMVKATLGRGCPGERVTFYLDGECPKKRTINERGKCRAKWKTCNGDLAGGPHTVTAALSCGTVLGEPGNVECP
ncbi:MAG: hypothetical protein IT449_04165 [Phycisphaerales bacterium]|nr:hypothetical protein [Phycisphaerales bacterium]